jgi:putative endonuclease
MKSYFVYILQCSDDTFYTGVTSNIDRRIAEHNSGIDKKAYTFKRRPVALLWFEEFSDPYVAFNWEKRIKSWSKNKKIALMEGRFNDLIDLSKKQFIK